MDIVAFLLASILLTLSPGPDIIYVFVLSIARGARSGIATAAGLVTGILVHVSLLAYGISALIRSNDSVYQGIQIVGALYLFYLSYRVFRAPATVNLDVLESSKKSFGVYFLKGFFMNIVNPKVTIFFLAFLPGFVDENSTTLISDFYLLGFLFMLQAFLIFSMIAIGSSTLSQKLFKSTSNQMKQRPALVLKYIQVVVFIGIGIFILL